ncbi:unnamed protein product [Closterium sp. Naga37s-1]|nr:unnamed protein product [Closterium sp. Naga37s-1]
MLDQSFVVLPPNSSAFHGASYGAPHAPRHGAAGGAIRPSINSAISAPPSIPRPPIGSPSSLHPSSAALSPAAGSAGTSHPASIPEEHQPRLQQQQFHSQDQSQPHPQQGPSTAEIHSHSQSQSHVHPQQHQPPPIRAAHLPTIGGHVAFQSHAAFQSPLGRRVKVRGTLHFLCNVFSCSGNPLITSLCSSPVFLTYLPIPTCLPLTPPLRPSPAPLLRPSAPPAHLDESFVVLPGSAASGSSPPTTSASYSPCFLTFLSFAPPSRFPPSTTPAPAARLDESFVVLPGSAASVYGAPALPHAPSSSSSSHARPSPHTHPFPLPPTVSGAAANAAVAVTAAAAAAGAAAAAVDGAAGAAAAGAGAAAVDGAPSLVSECLTHRGESSGSEQVQPENVTVRIGSEGSAADEERGRGGGEEEERRGSVEGGGERGDGVIGGLERGGDGEEERIGGESDSGESGKGVFDLVALRTKVEMPLCCRCAHHVCREIDAQIEAVDRVFDLVALRTKVEMPLCCHCAHHVCREIDAQVREAEEEIAAYEAALHSILATSPAAASSSKHHPFPINHANTAFATTAAGGAPMGEDAFRQHMTEVEEEERRLQQEAEELEQQRAQLRAQLGEVEAEQAELDAAEERYWHEFNEFQYQVSVHQEARDGLLASIEAAAAQSDALRRSFVLNDAFHIWHDGDFGTINNLRLGRLPSVPVEWEELNAAWGQACHLLFTLTPSPLPFLFLDLQVEWEELNAAWGQACHLLFTLTPSPLPFLLLDLQVEWEELNAAWGQACHLLFTLARIANCPIA